ncbi:MAG: hypothetical protein IPP74_07730 [Alphaproteobacteria bacterium]|nr:hypothetical protein [Alphaproteobacteria bacterium]
MEHAPHLHPHTHPQSSTSPALEVAAIIPVEVTDSIKKHDPLIREAVLSVDRNRWCLAACFLMVALLIALLEIFIIHQQFAHQVKVAWVKMTPSGTWDIEFYDETRQVEFFPATIDYMLSRFVERRYSKNPYSIRFDYGFSQQLMSQQLAQQFISPNQFNAPQVAADFMSCTSCPEIKITMRNINHFDSEKTHFNTQPGHLYRTNVFVRESSYYRDGTLKEEANKIVFLTWRLKSKSDIEADKSMLRINPIGIEILSSDYLDDPASPEKSKPQSVKETI